MDQPSQTSHLRSVPPSSSPARLHARPAVTDELGLATEAPGPGTGHAAAGDPIRTSVSTRSDITRSGVRCLLAPYGHRVTYVQHRPDEHPDRAQVVLFDMSRGDTAELSTLQEFIDLPIAVLVMTRPLGARLLPHGLPGIHGMLSPDINAHQLVAAIETAAGGLLLATGRAPGADRATTSRSGVRLTTRERQVLHGIAEGLTNQQIADTLLLSINSVKTYVRTAYLKIDVCSRSQAVAWVIHQGGYGTLETASSSRAAREDRGRIGL